MERIRTTSVNRCQEAFLLLLRAGLWEAVPTDIQLFPLSDDEWQQVYIESRRQSVQGLLYRGFQLLPESLFPPQQVMVRWLTDVNAIETANRHMLQVVSNSARILSDAGIHPVLQKGLAVAILYEHPELRSCGDIDWYIADDEWPLVESLLKTKGVSISQAADNSIFFNCDEVDIELHRRLYDIQDPKKQPLMDALSAPDDFVTTTVAEGLSVTTPNHENTMVLLMAHLMKHAMTVGIGLRQFCDLARAYHVWHGQYDRERLTMLYRQTGMERWTATVHRLLTDYLGLSPEELPGTADTDNRRSRQLMERIHRWGNFGQHTKSWKGGHSKHYTVGQIIRNLPFSLHYAPREILYKVKGLVKGQRRR